MSSWTFSFTILVVIHIIQWLTVNVRITINCLVSTLECLPFPLFISDQLLGPQPHNYTFPDWYSSLPPLPPPRAMSIFLCTSNMLMSVHFLLIPYYQNPHHQLTIWIYTILTLSTGMTYKTQFTKGRVGFWWLVEGLPALCPLDGSY